MAVGPQRSRGFLLSDRADSRESDAQTAVMLWRRSNVELDEAARDGIASFTGFLDFFASLAERMSRDATGMTKSPFPPGAGYDPHLVAVVESSWRDAGLLGRPTDESLTAVLTAERLSMDLVTEDIDVRVLADHWQIPTMNVSGPGVLPRRMKRPAAG